jgi:glycosyltransferase involved in cell wall biosynthesis
MPKISIVIPLYNKSKYVLHTIRSVISQNYHDLELLIIDNNSVDNGFNKAKQIIDNRIIFLQCEKQGPSSARNLGIECAKGEWILFLDADDLLETDYLEKQLVSAQANPDAGIIASFWQEFSDVDPTNKLLKRPAGYGRPNSILKDSTIAFAPWAVHAAIIKRSILTPEFYWNEELDQYLSEDTAFWFKLIMNYKVAYNKEAGALYRKFSLQPRDQYYNLEAWYNGINQVFKANLGYLKSKSLEATPGQCENLMRVYSDIAVLAFDKRSKEILEGSIKEADYWLKLYFIRQGKFKISLFIRRIFGCRLFLFLTYIRKKYR